MEGRPKRFSVRGCGGRLIANIARRSRGQRWIGFPRMSVSDSLQKCKAGCGGVASVRLCKSQIARAGGTLIVTSIIMNNHINNYVTRIMQPELCNQKYATRIMPPDLLWGR